MPTAVLNHPPTSLTIPSLERNTERPTKRLSAPPSHTEDLAWGSIVRLGLLEPWQADELERWRLYNKGTALELRRRGFVTQAQRLEICGAAFSYVACSNHHHPNSLRQSFCGQPRLCPICAGIERQRLIASHLPKLQLLEQHKPVSGYRLRLLTLTVRTTDYRTSRDAVEAVCKGFSRLWRGLLRGGRGTAPVGAIRAIEAAPRSGNIHAHVLYYGPYVAQAALSDAWEQATYLTTSPKGERSRWSHVRTSTTR